MEKIEQALPKGPVYVRHALYHGGGNAHWEVFANTTYNLFRDHIRTSNPGDWFTIWSIPDLISKNFHFLFRHYDKLSTSSEEFRQDFVSVKKFLEGKGNEVLLFFIPPKHEATEGEFNDIDGYDYLIETATKFNGSSVDFYAFDLNRVWVPEHILVDAKVPNASGEVPIGGAY